jgi:large subunit ribosomal protein L15
MAMTHEILAQSPRYKRRKRKGRGEASGQGKTAGRGTKGAGQRAGGPHWKPGHEGGQTPIHRRLPTRGFSNHDFARNWYIVNLGDLDEQFEAGATVDAAALKEKNLIPDFKLPIKILGNGTLSKKLTVTAGWYSKSAHAKIVELGGTAQNAKGATFEFPKPKKKFIPRDDAAKVGKKKAAAAAAEGAPAEGAAPAAPAAEAPKE